MVGVDIPTMISTALGLGSSAAGGLIFTVIILGVVISALLAFKADVIVTLIMVTVVTAVLYTLNGIDPVTSVAYTWAPYWLLVIEFFGLVVTLGYSLTHGGGGQG